MISALLLAALVTPSPAPTPTATIVFETGTSTSCEVPWQPWPLNLIFGDYLCFDGKTVRGFITVGTPQPSSIFWLVWSEYE